MVEVAQLSTIFSDVPGYAWQLLECQIQIESSTNIDGSDIARLLAMYMRGVERLNSIQDRRQNFFKSKVTSLMMRPNVVKSLSSPSKAKPQDRKKESTPSTISPQKSIPARNLANTIVPSYGNQLDIQQKKKEMEMRITYQSEEHTSQALNKLITQHSHKATTVNNCIQNVISENNKRIEQRIRDRKMRSLSARSRSQKCNEPKDQKKMFIDIEVIKEENQEDNKKLKNYKRKYSFEIPILPCEDFGKIQMKPRRSSVFEIHLTFTQVHN